MRYTIIAFMLIFATTIAVFAECKEADRTALTKFDKDWTDANGKGDRTLIASFYADEFMAFPGMVGKPAAIDNAVATAERNKANPQAVATLKTDHYQITCSPLTATIVHRNIVTQPGGKGEPAYSRSVHFLEKRNGKWVAVSNAGGPLNDADMLRYMELDWIDAVKNRNFDWMERNYAADFTEIGFMDGKVYNKAQTIEAMKADKTVYDAMEISELNIRVDGNTAVIIGLGRGRGKSGDGKPFDMKLRFTDTYVKRDGRWQAWASQATPIPSPQVTAKN